MKKTKKPIVTTALTTEKGTIERTGTSGLTITANRCGMDVQTLIEYSDAPAEEMREMICVLLCMLDELESEKFVASCFARYAEEMNKKFFLQENGRKLVIIRGGGV